MKYVLIILGLYILFTTIGSIPIYVWLILIGGIVAFFFWKSKNPEPEEIKTQSEKTFVTSNQESDAEGILPLIANIKDYKKKIMFDYVDCSEDEDYQ